MARLSPARRANFFTPSGLFHPPPDAIMHLPDGFLDAKTAAVTAAMAVAGLGLALRQLQRELSPRRVPLLGLGAAFVFAAQMVNFPVASGTSGHLVGGALIAALLGLPAAVVVVSTVVIAQCVFFADGGVTALGANVFNLAIVAPVTGMLVYRAVQRIIPGLRGRVAALAFAGWCSALAAAVVCAGQLAWSGTAAWTVAFPAMATVHMLIGLGEGAISALVFYAIARTRPDIAAPALSGGVRDFVRYGLLAVLGVALFVAPFACGWPDGLETVANRLGFLRPAGEAHRTWMAGYKLPGVASGGVATAVAGVTGALLAFGLAVLLSRLLVRGPAETEEKGADA